MWLSDGHVVTYELGTRAQTNVPTVGGFHLILGGDGTRFSNINETGWFTSLLALTPSGEVRFRLPAGEVTEWARMPVDEELWTSSGIRKNSDVEALHRVSQPFWLSPVGSSRMRYVWESTTARGLSGYWPGGRRRFSLADRFDAEHGSELQLLDDGSVLFIAQFRKLAEGGVSRTGLNIWNVSEAGDIRFACPIELSVPEGSELGISTAMTDHALGVQWTLRCPTCREPTTTFEVYRLPWLHPAKHGWSSDYGNPQRTSSVR